MIIRELWILFKSPILAMSGGFLTINIAQIEYVNELIGDDFSLAKNIIAFIGFGVFLWKSASLISKTNREKDQAYEEKQIDIETKAWNLAHDQKKANEEGLIEVIKDLEQTVKDLNKNVKK